MRPSLLLALLLARSTLPNTLPPSDAYIWQRAGSPALAQAVATNAALFQAWHVLAAEIAPDNHLTLTQADWPALTTAQHPVTPVIRIEGPLDPARTPALLAAVHTTLATLPEPLRQTLEIDHDSPTARLPAYTAFLQTLRTTLALKTLDATALPTWLPSPYFPAFAAATTRFILQVHAIDDPRLGIFDPTRATSWTRAAARQNHPFLLALPAYGARVIAAADGHLLAVSAEAPALDGTQGTEIAASPTQLAAFLTHLRHNPPPNLQALVWFRLPTTTDRRAWSPATLRAVIQGHPLHPETQIATRPGWTPGIQDIVVTNPGETDAPLPPTIPLPANCPIADATLPYHHTGTTLVRETSSTLLPPHRTLIAGWVRCPPPPNPEPSR